MDMPVIPCTATETAFHQFMTAVYGGLFLIGILTYNMMKKFWYSHWRYLQTGPIPMGLFKLNVLLLAMPGCLHLHISGIFLARCSWGESNVQTRFVVQLIVGLLTMFALFSGVSTAPTHSSTIAGFLAMGAWLMVFTADIVLSKIYGWQNIYYASGEELFPSVASNKVCGATEYLFYVSWTVLMGVTCFVTFLSLLLSGKIGVVTWKASNMFATDIGFPSILFMLINISFLGACRNSGHTIMREYGITTTVFYVLFVGRAFIQSINEGRINAASQTNEQHAEVQLNAIETATSTGSNSEGNDLAVAAKAAADSTRSSSQGRFACTPPLKAMFYLVCLASLNGWSGYIIFKGVKAM